MISGLSRRGLLGGMLSTSTLVASPAIAKFYKRPRYIRCVGDSIFGRGFALNVFQDQLGSRAHALWDFAAPHSMANLVFAENGVDIRFQQIALLGRVTQANLASDITARIASEAWQADDYFMIEDAGDHAQTPNAYSTALQGVIDAVAAKIPVSRIRTTTTPEYADLPGSLTDDLKWDVSFLGEGTMNQAIQAGSTAKGVTCVDTNTLMGVYRGDMSAFGAEVWLSDGIHPNVWGQMKWLGLMLNSFGLAGLIKTRASLEAIASANFESLRYGGLMTQQQAIDNCIAILG